MNGWQEAALAVLAAFLLVYAHAYVLLWAWEEGYIHALLMGPYQNWR
jgi:hypothetical protein